MDDLIEGIFRLLLSDIGDPVNIGNQSEISMLDLAKEVIQLTGSNSKLVFKELPEDDPKVRQPETTRAKKLLDWEARVDRKDGLRNTIAYFRTAMGLQG